MTRPGDKHYTATVYIEELAYLETFPDVQTFLTKELAA
jgi:hypothetical protein